MGACRFSALGRGGEGKFGGEALRNCRGVPTWTTPGRSLALKGDTQEWLKGEVGVLKTRNIETHLGAERNYSVEGKKLAM